ncbi:MAG: hypothetical protein U0790_25920 [Isosphaeraceae bacterium]
MGAEPYFYFVKHQADLDRALQELRRREFQAGRYYPAMDELEFPPDEDSPAPGARHASIEQAFEDADADGTRSILDLERVSDQPDFGVVTPLGEDALRRYFGTTEPTRAMIEQNMDFFEDIERGHGIAIVVHQDGAPSELFFAGYSYD